MTLFDRAGSGLSPGAVQDYGLDASGAELADVVRAVGPPVSLLAMSAAGPIALTLAHQHPEWVDSLVLFGTFASASKTFTRPGPLTTFSQSSGCVRARLRCSRSHCEIRNSSSSTAMKSLWPPSPATGR